MPVTCSHTFAALNIIEGEGPGLHEELCNEEGHVDTNKVLQLCPSWKKPMAEGIPCIVFRRELEAACPELPEFLSKAGSQPAAVVIRAVEVQMFYDTNHNLQNDMPRLIASETEDDERSAESVHREPVHGGSLKDRLSR